MARSLAQSWRRILPYQTPSRWWHVQSSEPSHFLLKSLPEVKSPGINCVRFISARASAAAQRQQSVATGKAGRCRLRAAGAGGRTVRQSKSGLRSGDERTENKEERREQTKNTEQIKTPHIAVSLPSPGYVRDPYSPSEPMSFWRRCLTIAGWKRTKEGIISKIKDNYAYAKVRRSYDITQENFDEETSHLYQEISTLLAKGDIGSMRKFVTDKMYSVLKNEIKEREMAVAHVQWELIMPMIKIRPFRARLIWTDNLNPMKSYAQITVEFLSEQKFVAYDFDGAVVAGDKDSVVLVREIWVFERSLFHEGAYWRLCGRIKL